jgi:hypothetical protein
MNYLIKWDGGNAEADDPQAAEAVIAGKLTEWAEAGDEGRREDFRVVPNAPDTAGPVVYALHPFGQPDWIAFDGSRADGRTAPLVVEWSPIKITEAADKFRAASGDDRMWFMIVQFWPGEPERDAADFAGLVAPNGDLYDYNDPRSLGAWEAVGWPGGAWPKDDGVEVVMLDAPGGVANVKSGGRVIGSVMKVDDSFIATAYPPVPAEEWTIVGSDTLDEAIDAVVKNEGVVRLSHHYEVAVDQLEAAAPGGKFRTIKGAEFEVGEDGTYWMACDGVRANYGSGAAALDAAHEAEDRAER